MILTDFCYNFPIILGYYPRRFAGGLQGLEKKFSRPFAFLGYEMRTAVYVDGFNFYYGAVKGTPYKWLNPKQLCKTILKPHFDIISVVYCTAKVRPTPKDPSVPIRQATYLKAIESYIPELSIIYGHFLETKVSYRPVNPKYGGLIKVFRIEEKGSDVNLAVHLVNDAHKDIFDCAIIISNDSDLAEAMHIVKDEYGKVVGLFTPWRRYVSKQLMRHSSFQRTIRKASLAKSQLPNPIPGTEIYKPKEW